jgi:NAD(P)-dependent dehydrogenase (short-subunit alcohol dehydrogenase family)
MADANDTGTQAAAPRRLITIFGGTGFLGRRVVRHLLGHNFEVRAASRHPERIASIFEPGKPGPHAVKADVHSEAGGRRSPGRLLRGRKRREPVCGAQSGHVSGRPQAPPPYSRSMRITCGGSGTRLSTAIL